MDRRFLTILAVVVVLFIGIFAVSQRSSNNANGGSSNTLPTSHVEGQGTSGVKLVEYGDFECPVCNEYYQPVKQVYNQFASQIYYQFRNLPLSTVHPNAFAAARATEAADNQGKYWQMHDALYENQDPNGTSGWVADRGDVLNDYFVKFAQKIGVADINKFKADYASEQTNNKINADVDAFLNTPYANHDIQKEATPSFFLDGKYIPNSELVDNNGVSVTKFATLINAEIAKKQTQ